MNSDSPKRLYVRQWGVVILALIIGVLIGTYLIPQLSNYRQRDFSVYSRHLQRAKVGPFELTFHSTAHYVTADVTLTGKKSVRLTKLYVEAGTNFSNTQDGKMSSISAQMLDKYGTFEGTLPVTVQSGQTEHIRLFTIPSNYNEGKVTGYMIDLGYK